MISLPPACRTSCILTPLLPSRTGGGRHRATVPSVAPVRNPSAPLAILVMTLRTGLLSMVWPVLSMTTASPWEPPRTTRSPRCLTACTPDFMGSSRATCAEVPEMPSSRAFEALLPARISVLSSETSRERICPPTWTSGKAAPEESNNASRPRGPPAATRSGVAVRAMTATSSPSWRVLRTSGWSGFSRLIRSTSPCRFPISATLPCQAVLYEVTPGVAHSPSFRGARVRSHTDAVRWPATITRRRPSCNTGCTAKSCPPSVSMVSGSVFRLPSRHSASLPLLSPRRTAASLGVVATMVFPVGPRTRCGAAVPADSITDERVWELSSSR